MKQFFVFILSCMLCFSGFAQKKPMKDSLQAIPLDSLVLTKADSLLIDSLGMMVIDSDFNLITSDTVMSNRFNENVLVVSDKDGNFSFVSDSLDLSDEAFFKEDTTLFDVVEGRDSVVDDITIMNEIQGIQEKGTSTELLISDMSADSSEAEFIKNYYVIVGSGRNLPALLQIEERINKDGYATEIIQNDKKTWYHIVLVDLYTKSGSSKTVFELREKGYTEAWRLKLE